MEELTPKKRQPSRIESLTHEDAGGESDSNWIVSYADMMTLLVGFFALLYSFAEIDKSKFEKIRAAVTQQFGGKFETPFDDIFESLLVMIENADLTNKVKVQKDAAGLTIVFQGELFFDSGSTEIRASARSTLDSIIDLLKKRAEGFPIFVEGHTDDNPIASPLYPSNWELSAGRASRVVRIFEEFGFLRNLLSAQGFSDTKPVFPNRDAQGNAIAENQARNRRVVIRVTRG
jgi:chemotaxis protein MotB